MKFELQFLSKHVHYLVGDDYSIYVDDISLFSNSKNLHFSC